MIFFVSFAAFSLLAQASSVTAASIRGSQKNTGENLDLSEIKIESSQCSSKTLRPLLETNLHFKELASTYSDKALDELCSGTHQEHDTNNVRQLQTTEPIPFHQITTRGNHFDKNYFDGGTSWNDNMYHISKEVDAGRIPQIEEALKQTPLEWPSDIVNFESCNFNTVMCCFTHSQRTGSNVPLTAEEANADVCHHDMRDSPQASHTRNGLTIHTDGRKTTDSERDAYCTGFAWSGSAEEDDTKYRANTLFEISFNQNFYKRSLVLGVQGAPMCGCIEQMPTVTQSECVKPTLTSTVSTSGKRSLQVTTAIEYGPCSETNDLSAHASKLAGADVSHKIVGRGQCPVAVDGLLAPMALKRGEASWYAEKKDWTPIVGTNDLSYPDIGESRFASYYEASSTKIIRRVCKSCRRSHRNIYYRRLEGKETLPEDMDLLNMLKKSWTNANNQMGVDFELYSSYDDALNRTNPWKFCNYSSSKGFPFECGPEERVVQQWTLYSSGSGTYAKDMAFYMSV